MAFLCRDAGRYADQIMLQYEKVTEKSGQSNVIDRFTRFIENMQTISPKFG